MTKIQRKKMMARIESAFGSPIDLAELYKRHGKEMYVISAKDYERWFKILKKYPLALKELRKVDTIMTPMVITPPNAKLRRRR